MRTNTSFDFGNLILIKEIDHRFKFFDSLLDGISGKAKHLKQSAKLFAYNRLGKCVSVNRLTGVYQDELFECLGFNTKPSERTLYRDLERIGNKSKFIINKYQHLIKNEKLVSSKQFVDFSSSYFEGNKAELGELGYSRDHEPGKKQITWGISTGINGIPTALTIQKGNVQDKKHMKAMILLANKVLDKDSMLIFDCGGNTKENKQMIRQKTLHYLTLKQKQRTTYKKYIEIFSKGEKKIFSMNNREYSCVVVKGDGNNKYIFFSKKLKKEQVKKRKKRFEKAIKKNDPLLKKVKKGKTIAKYISREGDIHAKGSLQTLLGEQPNPFITGLEGYFILESSVDAAQPEEILRLYKNKDRAEKLIRDMKEGTELRPIRHWSKKAVVGYLLIVFLTNCLIKLTQFLSKNTVVKNVKLLKKYLNNLTVTFIYPRNGFRYHVLSNISEEIRGILGDSLKKYAEKPPDWVENN